VGSFAVSDDHGRTISRILQHFGSCAVFLGVSLPLYKRQLFEIRNGDKEKSKGIARCNLILIGIIESFPFFFTFKPLLARRARRAREMIAVRVTDQNYAIFLFLFLVPPC